TQYNFANLGNIAAYRTNFPYCAGGIIRAEKDGYKDAWERVVTEANTETTLFLVPLFSFPLEKVTVVKHQLLPTGIDTARELASDESAIITLTYNKKEQPLNDPYHQSSAVWSKVLDPEVLKDEKLSFLGKADFKYVVSIDLLNENEFKGGYRGNWTVSWDQLQQAQEMIFHVVSDDNPSEQESLELLLGLGSGEIIAPVPEIK
ncbi:MAG: hypothetical protein Q8R37_06165, partial [Nanoarchaeota archaeon]|nr:hypothetical protein [Nanoarchaeota archaeon]